MVDRLSKKADSLMNSPGMTKNLLDSDAETPTKTSSKKKKKRNKSEHKNEEKMPVKKKSSSTSSLSSLAAEAVQSTGSLLRKGIRFASLEDFANFVDGGKTKNKERKRPATSEGGEATQKKAKLEEEDEQEEGPPSEAKKKLKASRFRYLNELLYTQVRISWEGVFKSFFQPGSKSNKMFRADRPAFKTYHEGYMDQLAKWPSDPLEPIVIALMKRSDSPIVADFGCGEARLAQSVPHLRVHSFDFVALNERVTECDMANTPLENGSVDVAVFCLSLMGTNLKDFLREANRVLKEG